MTSSVPDPAKEDPSKEMQESYERERQPEFDQAVQDAQGLQGREKIDALSDAAKKRDLGNRMLQSMGLEIGVGVAADILLPSPDPISRGLNFGIGYAANTLGQLWEGQGFSHGEAVAAGTFQAIPFGTIAKGAKGLYRAAGKGALQGVVGRQVEVGIDEQRFLTPQEALTSASIGGVFGGTVKGATEAVSKADLGRRMLDSIEANPYSKLRPLSNRLGLTPTGTVGAMRRPFKSTPERRWESIYKNKPKYKYPSLEALDLATAGPGYETSGKWYVRPSSAGGTSRAKWDEITKKLQKKHGGTEDQRQAFINQQRAAWKQTQNDIRQLNERFQFNYLEFSRLGLEELTENKVIDVTQADETLFQIYLEMASNPKKYPIFELGHIRSAKNIARESRGLTSADYASNLRAEIRRSIRDFTKYNPQTKRYQLIEPGNQTRKAHMDAPRVVNMLFGTSPNVEVEYIRFLGDFGYAMENIIPFERHEHFMQFMRDGISKWQRSVEGGLIGKQQLDQYPKIKNKLINQYLNMLNEGKFLDDKAKSDFIDQALLDRRTGLEAQRAQESEGRTVFRKTMPRFRGDERGAK
jgi:hypothetical protein